VGFDSFLGAANGLNNYSRCEGNAHLGKVDDLTHLRPVKILPSNIECDTQSFYRILQIMPSTYRNVRLCLWLIVLLLLPGCNALNPLCGSARPAPILNSISPKTMVFSQLPPSFVMIATGSHFVSSSVVVFNGATLATTVTSSSQL
jgi:hypothetical protein